jgi:anti-sigma factor RsiW
MRCEEVETLIEAYADGELSLERTLAIESHVATCATCAARLERVRALGQVLRTVPSLRAPAGLAKRVRATVDAASATQPQLARSRPRGWPLWLLSGATVAIASLALAVVLHERAVVADDATAEAVIEGHVRSLLPGHLMDVASTDQHTVKPWFAGRVDFSPSVVDLASDGFPLVGGRLDYIDHHAAAALVYKRRDHVINVFVWPQTKGSASHGTRSDVRGYHVISWTRAGVAVWVVSDLALSELDDFGRTLDAAMHD